MNISARNVKIFVGAVAALLVAGVAVSLFYASRLNHPQLRYRTQAALLAALPPIATSELASRGVTMAAPLGCWTMPEASPNKLRVGCDGRTNKGKLVQVIGAAEKRVHEQYFTILIDGRPLVQNANCLGPDCHSHH